MSKGTVVLRNGMTGFYLVINIGLPTQEKPKPYFFSRYISKKEEAVAEAMDLISSWEAAYKQAHTSCDQVIINNQNNGKEVNMEKTKVWVLTDRKINEDGVIAALQVVPATGDDFAFPAMIGRLVRQGSLGQAKFAWLIEGHVPLSVRVRQTRQDGSLGSGWKQVIDRPLPKSATFS